jgi:hypothetical protein
VEEQYGQLLPYVSQFYVLYFQQLQSEKVFTQTLRHG